MAQSQDRRPPPAYHPPPPTAPTAQTQKPPHPPAAQTNPSAAGMQTEATKKRKLEGGEFNNSSYFRIRATVWDLRKSFLEAIRAPNFRDCKAANEIRKKMKIILELSKQLRMETASPNAPSVHSFAGEPKKEQMDNQGKVNTSAGLFQAPEIPNTLNNSVDKSAQPEKTRTGPDTPRKTPETDMASKTLAQNPEVPEAIVLEAKIIEEQMQGVKGTYVIGGSPMGWNFLVYTSGNPVYYGVTKAAWLAKQAAKSI